MKTHIREALRKTILAQRNSLQENVQHERSNQICVKLFKLEQIQSARTVFIYMHFRSEVQTAEFIKLCILQGKTVTIPYTMPHKRRLLPVKVTDLEHDVEPGYYGIPEPVGRLVQTAGFDPHNIDVALIPGSVFDRSGGRLGYGGGYYDRFLANEASQAFRIGLAYELQVVGKVPVVQHDQLMNMVVTEQNIYRCGRKRHAQDSGLS